MSFPRSLINSASRWALALLGALPLLATAAPAQIVDLMTDRSPNATALVPARGFAGSAVEGQFNTAALAAGRLRVDVGGGRQLVATMTRESRGSRGDRSWVGEFEGAPGSLVTLTFHRGSVYGFMHHGADTWEVESRPNGRLQLFRLDERKLAPEGAPRARPSGDTASGSTVTSGGVASATAAEPVVQDMMVVYTAAAAASALANGTHIETRIINAVAAANAAYAASGVNITMNLVHMAQVSYTESGDMGVSLDRVTSTTDGYMDDVHALRNQYGADLVGLVTNETNYCGIAWVNSSASYAFSVTYWGCFAGQTFAHEVGHNQGNLHDRANSGSGGAYPYSYGYRTCDYPALANGQTFRTVMAYSCTGVPRVNYFSSPNLFYNGAPMGIAYETDPANSADNVRSMNNTAAAKAAFRTPTATLPATPGNLAGTAVSASQVNLTWTDNATDETAYSIERATGSGTFSVVATLAANVASYSNTGLAAATSYSYRVRAYNSSGYSQYSNVLTLSTQPAAAPAAPSNLAASAVSASQINLTWTDNASDETNNIVERSADGISYSVIATLGANVTSYSSTGLAASTTYSYRVKASNSSGSSAYSTTASATTQAAPTVPAPPGSPTVSLSQRTATVGWTDVATETSYELKREQLNTKGTAWTSTTVSLPANSTSRSESLSKGRTYRYSIRATNSAGSSAYVPVSCAAIAGCTNTSEFRVP